MLATVLALPSAISKGERCTTTEDRGEPHHGILFPPNAYYLEVEASYPDDQGSGKTARQRSRNRVGMLSPEAS